MTISQMDTPLHCSQRRSQIPLQLHQVWIDERGPTYSPPSKYDKYRSSLQRVNPDLVVKMWKEEDVLRLLETPSLSKYKDIYGKLPYPIMKADFARMLILYTQGGVYFDLDFVGRRPISQLLERHPTDIVLTMETEGYTKERLICNGFAAAVPGHPYLRSFLDYVGTTTATMSSGEKCVDIMGTTGPGALSSYSKKSGYPWKEWLVPDSYIRPCAKDGTVTKAAALLPVEDGPYAATMWWDGTGWCGKLVLGWVREMGSYYYVIYCLVVCAGVAVAILYHCWYGSDIEIEDYYSEVLELYAVVVIVGMLSLLFYKLLTVKSR